MDSDYLQFTRFKIQRRFKRLNTVDSDGFHAALLQAWGFLNENEITKGILGSLINECPDAQSHAEEVFKGRGMRGRTEAKHAALSYWVLRKCVDWDMTPEIERSCHPPQMVIKNHYLTKLGPALGGKTNGEYLPLLRISYVEPLFDYVEENLEDKRMMLTLLRKFKHRCEWFRRAELIQQSQKDLRKGEEILAYNLYEYLHDQGVQFHIEPESISGRVDLISAQSGKDRLVADAKIFNPQRGQDRTYLAKGFRQIFEYAKDYNEPFGYLVIFKTCEQDVCIATERQESCVPFVTHNNKTIFLLVIDIFMYEQPASKRGKLSAYEITPTHLIEFIS